VKTNLLKVPVNLIGGPLPLKGRVSTEIEVWDNSLYTIWPLDILVQNFDDFRPYARYLFWLPGQYIWSNFTDRLTVMNRIRVDKDVEGLLPEELRART